MYGNFEIETAQDMVKGFATAIRDNKLTLAEVHSFIMDCSDGDERLTQVVVEKTLVQLECMKFTAQVALSA